MWNILLSGLVQIGMVELCHFSAQSQIYQTQYMLLTHADALLCLQLHTVVSVFFRLVRFPHDSPLNTVNEPELDTHSFSEIRYNNIKVAKFSVYLFSSQNCF
jgi:hypothetical protein